MGKDDTGTDTAQLEGRALTIGMWGNMFMGASGILAAVLSNSQAILVDGLFSLIGFTAAFAGKRISRTATAGPDRWRPFGYAADEALFTTFRALTLLGLVLFAVFSAVMRIVSYLSGDAPAELNFAPMAVYFPAMALTCALLWLFHSRAWRRSGRRSDILRLEARAAAFDGLMTVAAGGGLVAIILLRDGPLAPIAPVGDSIIVLGLCSFVLVRFFRDFLAGLRELAGVTAGPEDIAKARRAIRATLAEHKGTLHDLSVTKLGRQYTVAVYYAPGQPVSATSIDDLTQQLRSDLSTALEGADPVVVISDHGRRLPDPTEPPLTSGSPGG